MKKHLAFLLCLGLFCINAVNAQYVETIYYSEDFGNGFNGWTTVSNSAVTAVGETAEWIIEADATSNGAFGQRTISSPTAANGVLLFDSDYITTLGVAANLPPAPYPINDGEVISPTLDLSGITEPVSIRFYQSFRGFTVRECFFSYSVDGGITWTDEVDINETALIQQGIGEAADDKRIIALPGASGSSAVQVKFRGSMNFYQWILDDIAIIKTPEHAMSIASSFYAIAPSYKTPQYQADTVRFLADVANVGSQTQDNVTLTVDVTNSSGASVFNASTTYGSMAPQDTVENQLFTSFFVPDTIVEQYTATYTLTSDSSASYPTANNIISTTSFSFEVTADEFSKGDSPQLSSIAPGADNSWTFGTSYFNHLGTVINGTNNLDTTARYASHITFGVANADDLAGFSVDVFLESFVDADGNGQIEQTERTTLAFGSHTFSGAVENNVILEVPIDNFIGATPLYQMESNTNYLVSVRYAASADENLFALVSYNENYNAADFAAGLQGVNRVGSFLDIGNSNTYNTITNFSGNPTPLVGLKTQTVFTTNSSEVTLPESAFTVFPNPAVDFITATVELEETTENARFVIYNTAGQIVETRNLSNVQNEQVRFNLDNYTSGTYFISIDTDNGHSIKRFIVNK